MSVLSNTKAQLNKMYTGLKGTPLAKGIKGVLHEENLVRDSQNNILKKIYTESKSEVENIDKAFNFSKEDLNTRGMNPNDTLSQAAKKSMSKVDDIGIDAIEDGDFKTFLNGRFKEDDAISKELQNRAILNKAKANVGSSQSNTNVLEDDKVKSFILDAAKEVDGNVAFMTPIEMAKEYYGKPITGAINNIRKENYKEALKGVGVAGARVGVTAGAIGGAGALAHGTASVTSSAFNRMRGNVSEGDQQ